MNRPYLVAISQDGSLSTIITTDDPPPYPDPLYIDVWAFNLFIASVKAGVWQRRVRRAYLERRGA